MRTNAEIIGHYSQADLRDTVLEALRRARGSLDGLAVEDLAPVDGFHVRGRQATAELAELAGVQPGWRVLDLGCGPGGAARHLAAHHGCRAVGIDLTPEYVALAATLSRLVGLDGATRFQVGSVTALPFAEAGFDCAWLEHVQMNIADKAGLVREVARVLRRGGRLAAHEVFCGDAEQPHFPVPWATAAETSFMVRPEAFRALLEEHGMAVREWRDVTEPSRAWFARRRAKGPPPDASRPGIHLLMGADAGKKVANLSRSLEEGRLRVVQLVAEKRS